MSQADTDKQLVEERADSPTVDSGWRVYDWVLLGCSLVVNGLAWGVILWKLPQTDATIFLHYNIYYGVDLTGRWHEVFYIPGSGAVILLLNAAVLWFTKALGAVLRTMVLAVTLGLELAVLLASVLVVLLNN